MISLVISILSSVMPLVIATVAVLFSEYAGRMIFFVDGLVTLCAFICFSVTVKTQSFALGIALCILIPAVFVFLLAYVIEKFHFKYFIVSLAQNVFLISCVTVLSAVLFKNRGVLLSEQFVFSQTDFKIVSIAAGFSVIFLSVLFFTKTKAGLYLKITGSDSLVLLACGVNPGVYRILSWGVASVLCSLCGIIMLLRLSSFVPGISSGIGWASLALVFLGRRNIVSSIFMAFLFGISQFAASNIQSILIFQNVPPAVLLGLPYMISLLFIVLVPGAK